MRADFDYNLVPNGYAHCLNNQCPSAANCLRHQLVSRIPSECKFIRVVNPAHTVSTGEECPYFKPDRTERFASGMKHLLDKLPFQVASVIRQQLKEYYGKNFYYRLWRNERLFTPEDQEYIRQLFRSQGIVDEPSFDEYVERYEW